MKKLVILMLAVAVVFSVMLAAQCAESSNESLTKYEGFAGIAMNAVNGAVWGIQYTFVTGETIPEPVPMPEDIQRETYGDPLE